MKRVALVAGLIVVVASPPAAADDLLLTRLAGEWIGRGIVRQKPDAEPERIYCKIENELRAGGAALRMEGRCAVADQTARIAITLTADGPGHYTGSGGGLGVASRGQTKFTATGTQDRLEIDADLINTQTHETAHATAVIAVAANGRYGVQARMTDKETGTPFTVSEIVFAAK